MHPVLIDLGWFQLSTYGALVAAAYLAAVFWLKARRLDMGLSENDFWTLIYAVFFGAIFGGKLLYLAVEYEAFIRQPWEFLRDFRYGFVFYGGFLGALAMGAWAWRRLRFDFAAAADHFATALPLGQSIGRLGCLAAGCCYGRPTELPWGVVLEGASLHPTQLYESLACLASFFALKGWVLPRVKSGRWPPGSAFIASVALYGAARFLIEFYRFDERGASPAPFSISQWIALALLGACGAWLISVWRRRG